MANTKRRISLKAATISYLEELTAAVNRSMLFGIDPERGTLEAAMHYALSVKGKRLRPLLFLTLLDAHQIPSLTYVDVAAAIEIIHTYSLIHDDMPCMDDDDLRRGFPTVHKKFNEAVALLTGDTLLTFAFEKIVFAPLPAEIALNIMRLLTRGIGKEGMAGGQALDLEFSGKKEVVEEIHRKKTAELIKSTLLSAAQIIGFSPQQQELLAEAGNAIGVGFQLADDLLDLTGNEEEVGKKLRKDCKNKSPNAVLYFGGDEVRARVDTCYRDCMERIGRLGIQFPPFLSLLNKMVYRSS